MQSIVDGLTCSYAVCWNRETSSPPVTGAGAAVAEDSRSESGETQRSEPKNKSPSPPAVVSHLPGDLTVRRGGPSSVVLGPDDYSNSSSDSRTDGRTVSPRDQHRQPYNMTYYGGPHGIAPASQLLQHHRHHQHQQLVLHRQHHLQPSHHLHPDNLTTYPPLTDDESTAAVEAELYCSAERDQYYGHSSPVMHYYTQNATSAAIKCLDDIDRM